MEEQRSGGHRVRRTITVTRRLQNHKITIELQGNCVVCDRARMTYHEVFGFLIPLLVAVLQVNNQGTNKYSFETHQANLWVFLLATLVYCFAFVADIKYYNPSYAQLYSLLDVISGSLSSVSLISLLVPDLPGRLIFIPWAFVSIVVSRSLIICLCCWLYQMIMKTFFQVVGIWNRFKGSCLTEQPRLPV